MGLRLVWKGKEFFKPNENAQRPKRQHPLVAVFTRAFHQDGDIGAPPVFSGGSPILRDETETEMSRSCYKALIE
jgi:hypothetical protein